MNLKQVVGIEAAKYVEDGMIVSLGTGSTAEFMVDEIGRRVKEEGLSIVGVTTSKETGRQALALDIPLKGIDEVPYVDLMIDGADEVSADFQGIEGGGTALFFEGVAATYSKRYIWIVDESEMMDDLRAFPLPAGVVPHGGHQLVHLFEEEGYHPAPRLNVTGETLIADGGHHIIDLHLEEITNPEVLGSYLDNLVGVVEHGLFSNMVSMITVGYEDGPKILHVPAHWEYVKKDYLYRKDSIWNELVIRAQLLLKTV